MCVRGYKHSGRGGRCSYIAPGKEGDTGDTRIRARRTLRDSEGWRGGKAAAVA